MNARSWFYSQSFNGRIDRSTPATHSQITEKQICSLCNKEIDMLVEFWAKLDGKIVHDCCLRLRHA